MRCIQSETRFDVVDERMPGPRSDCRLSGADRAAAAERTLCASTDRIAELPRAGRPIIEVDAVEHHYGKGANGCIALRGITLTIRANDFIALVGPSGSGKSTLLNLMGGLDTPTAGQVRFEGRDLATLGAAERSEFRLRRIGFVFQYAHLVPVLSVAENVELPLLFRREIGRAEREKRVASVLAEVGLADKGKRLPSELSGGELQRAALARALAGRPTIILADEPTANLDQAAGATVIDLMRTLNTRSGTAIICATHDAHLMRSVDAVWRMQDGRIEKSLT